MSNEVSFCLFYPLNTLQVEYFFAFMPSAGFFFEIEMFIKDH